jgi:hypothetical protein
VKNKVTCSLGEEYSKEEILRIPPTFSGFDSKAFETFSRLPAFEKPFSKNSTSKSTRKAHSTKNFAQL